MLIRAGNRNQTVAFRINLCESVFLIFAGGVNYLYTAEYLDGDFIRQFLSLFDIRKVETNFLLAGRFFRNVYIAVQKNDL